MNGSREPDPRSLVRRLTGPEEPELSCEQCFAELDRYVELQIDGRDADVAVPGMRAHLEGCSACHEDRLSLRDLMLADRKRE